MKMTEGEKVNDFPQILEWIMTGDVVRLRQLK